MSKGHHRGHRDRFEDFASAPPNDAASFFFDLKLLLPSGMPAHDVQVARQKIEHRLQRTLRKKDRVVWTADGFFLLMATSHPARASAAAERIQQDLCSFIDGDTGNVTADHRGTSMTLPPPRRATPPAHGRHAGH